MEQKHTPEPWESVTDSLTGTYIRRADGLILAKARELNDSINHEANAARIVACVNACAGMVDPATEIAALRSGGLQWWHISKVKPIGFVTCLIILSRQDASRYLDIAMPDESGAFEQQNFTGWFCPIPAPPDPTDVLAAIAKPKKEENE